ncbi:MAG: glycosyltransferase, partial [Candidatus Methanomethylophilus sp.]|nr:glycosyltransferase [Methanomethylophilus sp.]
MALKALIASHNTGVPTVLTYDTLVTDVIEQYSPIKLPKETLVRLASIYLRQMLKRPNTVAVPTPSAGREITEVIGAKPKRMEVIPTGIDTDHFTRSDAGPALREKYGIQGKKVVIFVGRLSYEKNVDLLIRSLKLMADDVVLMVVGQGPAMESLRKTVEEEGMNDRVIFTGYVFDQALVDHYSCADVFASASVFETQGFTVQEAMSCGLPVACGNGRAFTDFIVDGENGYLFNLTEEEWAAAMTKALN